MRHAFQAAAGEHGEQLRLGEGEGQLGVARSRVGVVDQHPVRQGHAVALAQVGEVPVDGQLLGPRLGTVDADGDRVEELLDGQGGGHPGTDVRDGGRRDPVAELGRAHQGEVASGAVLGALAQPFEGLGEEVLGSLMVGVDEDGVLQQLGGEAEVPVVQVVGGLGHHGVGASDGRWP